MEQVHYGHNGINGSLSRARDIVYWPNMTADIKIYVKKCETCNTYQSSQQREPLISIEA